MNLSQYRAQLTRCRPHGLPARPHAGSLVWASVLGAGAGLGELQRQVRSEVQLRTAELPDVNLVAISKQRNKDAEPEMVVGLGNDRAPCWRVRVTYTRRSRKGCCCRRPPPTPHPLHPVFWSLALCTVSLHLALQPLLTKKDELSGQPEQRRSLVVRYAHLRQNSDQFTSARVICPSATLVRSMCLCRASVYSGMARQQSKGRWRCERCSAAAYPAESIICPLPAREPC